MVAAKRGHHCQRWWTRWLRGFPIPNLVKRTLKTKRANPNDSGVASRLSCDSYGMFRKS